MRDWMKRIRKTEMLTQKKLAEMINIDITSVNKIELGLRQPSPKVAKRLAKALDFEKYGFDWTKFYDDDGIPQEAI